MFWLRNMKNNFQLHTLIWGPDDHRGKSSHYSMPSRLFILEMNGLDFFIFMKVCLPGRQLVFEM